MKQLTIILLVALTLLSPAVYGQYTPPPVKISTELVNRDGLSFFVHHVEKKQTLFSIAKAYNVVVNVILEDNPALRSGIKEGDLVYIRNSSASKETVLPETPKENPAKEEAVKTEMLKHTVRWYETLESIAKLYNVSVESIVAANSLTGSELNTRQILQIPASEPANGAKEISAASGYVPLRQSIFKEHKSSGNHTVSLVLPFDSKNFETNPGNNNYLDFYQGFLLAVNDMRVKGMSMDLRVFDTKDYTNSSMIAQSGRLDGSELVIGPVFSSEIEGLIDYTKDKRIPLVSPMDPDSEKFVANNSNFFQVSVPVKDQQEELLNSVPAGSHVAIFYEESSPDISLVNLSKEILTQKGIPFTSLSYNLLKGRSVYSALLSKLDATKENSVIVISNSEAFVSDMLRNLNLINTRSGYKITLYGTPRWRNFENVDINYYHSMNLHISLQYNVNYSSEDVKVFLSKYRALFGTEPSPYAFQAYDLGLYFLGALYNYGPDFVDYLNEFNSGNLLQSSYKFVREGRGNGFINRRSRLIIYRPDYSIESGSFVR
ncbi:MAG TPA: LysM peptidoglycan-binding domain-containing protein [Bacteroidales bacterium]|nr:LysM peptidoglycan-binding domain-containing protein [Bacteroidales bacterium]